MSRLADALEAYELAIACGATSLDIAARFADLASANHVYVRDLHAAEETVARVWDRVLPAIEVDA